MATAADGTVVKTPASSPLMYECRQDIPSRAPAQASPGLIEKVAFKIIAPNDIPKHLVTANGASVNPDGSRAVQPHPDDEDLSLAPRHQQVNAIIPVVYETSRSRPRRQTG